jgi:CHAT domain
MPFPSFFHPFGDNSRREHFFASQTERFKSICRAGETRVESYIWSPRFLRLSDGRWILEDPCQTFREKSLEEVADWFATNSLYDYTAVAGTYSELRCGAPEIFLGDLSDRNKTPKASQLVESKDPGTELLTAPAVPNRAMAVPLGVPTDSSTMVLRPAGSISSVAPARSRQAPLPIACMEPAGFVFVRGQVGYNVLGDPSSDPMPLFLTSQDKMVRKILFLSANPTDTGRLRLDKEVREIEEGLKRSNERRRFELIPRFAVKADDLRRSLLDSSAQIVHFAGHGEGNDGILVENDQGQAFQVPTDALADLFELCAGHIECVVLNACYSEVQADAIAKHIPYVIGMKADVSDGAAREFAVGFYDAIGAGKSIEDAFRFGCNAIALKGIPEHLVPVLKKKP